MHVRVRDPSGYVRTGTFDGTVIDIGDRSYRPESITWLAPSTPTKIVCLARNNAAHAAEHDAEVPDRPEYFLKPPSALAAHRGTVVLPSAIDRVEYEAELAAVIDRQLTACDPDEAMDGVAGLTCLNDLSNRADQRAELNWVRGKAFDGAAVVGPGVVDPANVPADASIELAVNGTVRQHGNRADYVFDLPTAIAELTDYLTLEPGDIVALGTTAGVGPLEDGDEVSITIDGIGTLAHSIEYRK